MAGKLSARERAHAVMAAVTCCNFGLGPPHSNACDMATAAIQAHEDAVREEARSRLAAFEEILAARERWGVMAYRDVEFAMAVGRITDPWKNGEMR